MNFGFNLVHIIKKQYNKYNKTLGLHSYFEKLFFSFVREPAGLDKKPKYKAS